MSYFFDKFHRAQTSAGCARRVLTVLGMRPDSYAVSISYILLMPFHRSTGDRRNRKAWRVLDGTTRPNEGVRTLLTRGGVIQRVRMPACQWLLLPRWSRRDSATLVERSYELPETVRPRQERCEAGTYPPNSTTAKFVECFSDESGNSLNQRR
jgi:hypothetical protein